MYILYGDKLGAFADTIPIEVTSPFMSVIGSPELLNEGQNTKVRYETNTPQIPPHGTI